MDLVKTKRGRTKLVHEGYMFVFDKCSRDDSTNFWRCEFKKDCKVRVHSLVATGEVVKQINEHSHGSDAAQVGASSIITQIKARALDTTEIPSVVFNESLQNSTSAVQGKIPNKDAIRKVIQRVRNDNSAAPPLPLDRMSIVIPDQYRYYTVSEGREELFLLWDSGALDNDRILLFGREANKKWSNQIKKIYIDGTFSLAPSMFAQIYVVMAERNGFVLPIMYALLPNKEGGTYYKLFQAIKELWPDLEPLAVSMDYEQGAIQAFRAIFPLSAIHGCLFHLTKNLRKHLSEHNLLRRYNNDAEFALHARMIVSLSFVPIDGIEIAMEALEDGLPIELAPILNWFEDNYVGRPGRNGNRRRPLFPPDTWTVYERTIQGQDRTNNFAEGAHRRLQAEFGMDHPNLWKFIDGIRNVQKGRDHMYEQFVRGDQKAGKRKKYVDADKRILNIVSTYGNRNILEYLRGIAHNFLME